MPLSLRMTNRCVAGLLISQLMKSILRRRKASLLISYCVECNLEKRDALVSKPLEDLSERIMAVWLIVALL